MQVTTGWPSVKMTLGRVKLQVRTRVHSNVLVSSSYQLCMTNVEQFTLCAFFALNTSPASAAQAAPEPGEPPDREHEGIHTRASESAGSHKSNLFECPCLT